jgi:hypothetical protein
MTPTKQKSLPYLIYSVGIDLDAHVWVFWKAIQTNGERNDSDIINLFCFTLRDAISRWGEIFMQFHPGCTFIALEATFYKCYWKATHEHVYIALRVIKQAMDKKKEVYYECILKLGNCLNHKADNNLLDIFPSKIGTLFVGSHDKDELGYIVFPQRSCGDM